MSNNFISFNDFQKQTLGQNIDSVPKEATVQVQTTTQKIPNDSFEILSDELKKAKKKNGLIEKLADKIKSLTGIGYSSKKIENSIQEGKSEEEVKDEIKKYRASQENIAQATGDVASSVGAISAFFGVKQGLEKLVAQFISVNDSKEMFADKIKMGASNVKKEKLKNFLNNFAKFFEKNIDKRNTVVAIGAVVAGLAGGLIKWALLKINRIGSKEFKPEIDKETMSKKEIKQIKKQNKKERKRANRRNFFSGAINGLTTPILSALGAVGAPIYVAINSLNRYFIGTREDKGKKSLTSYIENLKNSAITHITSAIAIAIPAIQKGKFNKVFEKNLDKTLEKLKKSQLSENLAKGKTSYEQLEEILFGNEKINKIMNDGSLSAPEKIQLLTEENLFAVKFKQINSNSDDLARALKTDCPPTRTLDEAQSLIDKAFGKKYKVEKCVGVGTVAETYLVKEGDKEFCIKMLKNGITAEKIKADEKKFIDIINALEGKTPEEKEFLIANVKNIAQGVLAEVDFSNEMKAAQELAKVTQKAKLVRPITVKNGLYLMEKADGISLSDFCNFNVLKRSLSDWRTGKLRDKGYFEQQLQEAQKNLQDAMSRKAELEAMAGTRDALWYGGEEGLRRYIDNSQDSVLYYEAAVKEAQQTLKNYDKFLELQKLGIDDLSEEEAKRMLETYQDIIVEQFSEVGKEGKIIHGDIHPGNIFIDIKGLKEGRSDFFTLIDTGNTIVQDKATALRFLNLSHYIKNADYENIADFVLEGATLPKGLDKAKARAKLIEELKKAFFDDKTHTGKITNDNILALTDSIMQKLNIIPADTQGNLMKSKTSARQSLEEFTNSYIESVVGKLEEKYDDAEPTQIGNMVRDAMIAGGKIGKTSLRLPQAQQLQEKKNLALLSPTEKIKFKKSKSAPAKNSEEYLTYLLKQSRKSASEITLEIKLQIANFTRNFANKCRELVAKNTGKDVWSLDINKLNNKELIEQLNEAQKKEMKEPLERIIKYIEKLPDSEQEKATQLKEYKELLDLLTKKAS